MFPGQISPNSVTYKNYLLFSEQELQLFLTESAISEYIQESMTLQSILNSIDENVNNTVVDIEEHVVSLYQIATLTAETDNINTAKEPCPGQSRRERATSKEFSQAPTGKAAYRYSIPR